MKFIISLALKYIRRQKLRSVLTFTSITLAVFIMNIFFVFFGTIQRSLRNNETELSGSWETELSSLFRSDDNIREKYEQIAGNAAVGDSFLSAVTFVSDSTEDIGDSIKILSYEVSDSASFSDSYIYINSRIMAGNSEIYTDTAETEGYRTIESPETDEIILPSEFSKLGYNVNDTITLSVTPLFRTIKISSPYVNAKAAENGIDPDSPNFLLTVKNLIINSQDKDSIPFDTETYGNTVTGTYKIAGFQFIPSSSSHSIFLNLIEGLSDSDLITELYNANSDILEQTKVVQNMSIRIKDELSFSNGMEELVKDLGYHESYYSLLDSSCFHTELLAYELRDYYGLVDFVQYIFIFSVIVIICWFLSRFIIDNAFEISAQERNAQFAILRIIGSSKKQITAFTFTEAAFYSLTAIPAGTFLSILFSYLAFSTLKNYLTFIELYINPLFTAIGITLSLLAVFISSYTSALYSSRKRSLSETYYNAYLPDNIKTGKEKKTTSSMRSGRFIRRYTIKNILRTKKRFIISSAALITGTLMLTFSGILGVISLKESEQARSKIYEIPDFNIFAYTDTDRKIAQDHIRNNPLFSEFWSTTTYYPEFDEESITEVKDALFRYGITSDIHSIEAADERFFNKYLSNLSDISYTKFSSSSQGIILIDGEDERCIELDEPVTLNFSGGSVDISRIIEADSRMWFSTVIIPEKSVSGIFSDTKNIMYYSEISCKLSGPKKYTDAKEYIRDKIKPESFEDRYADSTADMAVIYAIIKLASILLAIIWLTGVISMANSVNSSVLNRENELIMMRSVGMSMKQMRNTVITESVLFPSFSTAVGVAAGTILFRLLFNEPIREVLLSITGIMLAVIIVNTAVSVMAAIPGIHSLKNKLKV